MKQKRIYEVRGIAFCGTVWLREVERGWETVSFLCCGVIGTTLVWVGNT